MDIQPFSDATWNYSIYSPSLENQFASQANILAPGIVGFAEQISVAGESIIDAIARAMGTVQMAQAQRELLSVQIERAKLGLPPLDVSNYAPVQNASGTVTYQQVPAKAGASPLLLLALGAGAVMLLKK